MSERLTTTYVDPSGLFIHHYSDGIDGQRIRFMIRNVRRIACKDVKRERNWVIALELFACGSTIAHHICRRAGIEPDGRE